MSAPPVRYVALLRGVSPVNLKMPVLARSLEAAGFGDVRTVLSSGNAVFTAPRQARERLEAKVEEALLAHAGRAFPTIMRSREELRALLEADPWASFDLPPQAKRVVTFLRRPPAATPALPPETDGARVLAVRGGEVLTAYVPTPRGAVFMALIEKTFGKDVTTRTWDTVRKLAR